METLAAPIHWGIVGCGNVCEVKSGPAFAIVPDNQLVAVMRRNGSLAQDYARRHHVAKWYDDAAQLIADPQVNAVYIATPPGSHLEYALQVAAAGKACYVEKPMARSHAECRRMVEAFDQRSLPLFVAYYRRALPRFIKIKELIDAGHLGQITTCRYGFHRQRPAKDPGWRIDVKDSGGGLFLDVGSHALDLLDFLLGEFVDFGGTAHGPSGQPEETVALHFRTSQGVVGTGEWNFAASQNEDCIIIEGSEGRIRTSVLDCTPIQLDRGNASETFTLPDPPHVQQPLITTVVQQLLARGNCPSTGQTAARTSRVMDDVLSSYYGGRDDEFWSRPWPHRA